MHRLFTLAIAVSAVCALPAAALTRIATETPRPAPRACTVEAQDDKRRLVVNGVPDIWYDDVADPRLTARRCVYAARIGTAWHAAVDGVAGPAYDQVAQPTISTDEQHIAYMARSGNAWRVVLDGVAGESYETVFALPYLIGVWPGDVPGLPTEDCRPGPNADAANERLLNWQGTLVYVGHREGKARLIVGDWASPWYATIRNLYFGPDGRRAVWCTVADGAMRAVVDGRIGEPIDREGFLFSRDSAHVAYVGREGRAVFVVLDGVRQPAFDRIEFESLRFSPDGTRLTYVGYRGKAWYAVVGGVEHGPYTALSWPLVHSADSRQVAYSVRREDGTWVAVRDGVADPLSFPRGITHLAFSPDGRRLFYIGTRADSTCALVVDGAVVAEGPSVSTPVFSPDGARMACVVAMPKRQGAAIVVDGVQGPAYKNPGTPVFSPDSRRMAHIARDETRYVLVVDGRETRLPLTVTMVGTPVFSPDGAHVAYVAGRNNRDEHTVMVDDTPGTIYPDPSHCRDVRFDAQGRLCYTVARDGRVLDVVEEWQ